MENTLPPAATVDLATPTTDSPRLPGHVEDRAIEQYIKNSGRFLEEVRLNPSVLERLTDYGFGDEEISVGMSLQNEALTAYYAQRGSLPTDLDAATAQLEDKIARAREHYVGFRLVGRAAFTDLNDRANLRVLGDVPDDLQRLINKAYAAYTAAGEAPYAEKMSKRGYPAERLGSLKEFLDALTSLDATTEAAVEAAGPIDQSGDPLDAGEEIDKDGRDAAYKALRGFMKELKGILRAIFRKEPETLEQLRLID